MALLAAGDLGAGGLAVRPGESVIHTAVGVSCTVTGGARQVQISSGTVLLTSERIVVVNTGDDDPPGVAVPVSLAKNGRLEQPWFGANYFACESAPVPFGGLATGGDVGPDTPDLGVVVTFNQGGADAFAMQWIALASRRAVQRAPGGQPPGAQHSGPNEAYSTPSQPHSVMVPTTMLAPTAPPAEPETDSAQAAAGSAAAAGSDVDGGAPPSYSSIYGKKND